MADQLHLFFSSWQIWQGAVVAGVIAGVVCGFIGIYVVLHRMVFVSAAMSEVSSLGVMIAFWLAQIEAVKTGQHTEDVLPLSFAAIFTGAFALAMANQAAARLGDRSKSAESLIGAVYLVSAAGLLVVGDRVTQGAHDVANVLFGNTVIVDSVHLTLLAVVFLPILLIHIWLKKDLVFISFDPSMALTLGYPVARLRAFLLISLGIVISLGTRTLGALPVFSFSVLPPMAALLLFPNLKGSFWVSALIGGTVAFLGYAFSFLFSFPTGACMTLMAAAFLGFAKVIQLIRDNALHLKK